MKNYNSIAKFRWPFYSYDVLMPKHIKKDLFEWLYLSLIVCKNKENGIEPRSYTKDIKSEVISIIKSKFSLLIDDNLLENIIKSAEQEFTEEIIGNSKFKISGEENSFFKNTNSLIKLKDETIGFIDTYEDLFSSQVFIQRIYQDGITGEVVPCFNDMQYINDAKDKSTFCVNCAKLKRPAKSQIKRAFIQYNRLLKAADAQEEILNEPYEEIIDPDAEVDVEDIPDFDTDINKIETDNNCKNKNLKSNTDFNVIYLKDTKLLYDLEIEVFKENNELYIGTPFDKNITELWINKLLKYARSKNSELEEFFIKLEKENLKTNEIETEKDNGETPICIDIASKLKYCEKLYRLVENLPKKYDDIKKLIIEIDGKYKYREEEFFVKAGKYLECLINFTKTKKSREMDYDNYILALTEIERYTHVNISFLLNNDIYINWHKNWPHFKGDLADLFINDRSMMNNKYLYEDFVKDCIKIYNDRNIAGHYNKKAKPIFEDEYKQIEKLFKITRVFIELLK